MIESRSIKSSFGRNGAGKIALIALAAFVAAITGCVSPPHPGNPLPPEFYGLGAAAATKAGLSKAKPETIAKVAAAQTVVCALVKDNTITPKAIESALDAAGVKDDIVASAAADLVVMGYIAIYHSNTNTAAARPYATAIFCDGWAAGLAAVSAPKTRAMSVPEPDPVWPLITLPAK